MSHIVQQLFNVLIVDSDPEGRSRLKQAARAMSLFDQVLPVHNLRDAINELGPQSRWDIIFLADRLGDDAIIEFIEDARANHPRGKDCAYIIVIKGPNRLTTDVVTKVAKGVDGFLCEPYSAESLKDSSETAVKVKLNSCRARFKLALRVLLVGIVAEVDKSREGTPSDYHQSDSYKELIVTCRELLQLSSQAKMSYTDIVSEIFDELVKTVGENYQGASKRVRERLNSEASLREQLKQELLAVK